MAQDDDGGGETNSRIPASNGFLTLASTGTFTIEATSFDPSVTGSYTLTFNTPASSCPAITNFSPTVGLVGANVTITGSNFNGASEVRFTNNLAASFTVNSNTQISATVPTGASAGPITVNKTGCPSAQSATFTVTTCIPNVTPASQSFGVSGGVGSIAVTNGTGCAWTASSNVAWVNITSGSSGNGTGTVNYTVAANTGAACTGTLTIAGQTFTVNQAAACSYSILPTSQNFGATGGSNAVSVTAPAGCTWTATSNATWITINSGSSGSGNGAVNYTVVANTGPQRSGTVTIAGQTFTVNQDSGCSFTINPTNQSYVAAGGNGSVTVNASDTACTWTAASNAAWIAITNGATGMGNGAVNYTVAANTGGARTGTLTIAGQTFTVMQAAPCSYSLLPTSQSFSAAGGVNSVGVTAASGCAWTAVSNDSWVTITAGANGTGNGTVNYSIVVNTGPARIGTLTIAG